MSKSELIIEALKKRGREKIVDVDEEMVKLVIFSLSGGLYAFYGSDVKEVLPICGITRVPGTPAFILGVVNIRGDIESVISINDMLGLASQEKPWKGFILVTEKNGDRTGILVDEIRDVVDVPVRTIRPPISTIEAAKKDLVSGGTLHGSASVALLDLKNLLTRIKV